MDDKEFAQWLRDLDEAEDESPTERCLLADGCNNSDCIDVRLCAEKDVNIQVNNRLHTQEVNNGRALVDHDSILKTAREEGRKYTDYLVLSSDADPFYAGRQSHIKWAEWFMQFYRSEGYDDLPRTKRAFHYDMDSVGMLLPDGTKYRRDNKEHYHHLSKAISYALRLELLPDSKIIEEKQRPETFLPSYNEPEIAAHSWLYSTGSLDLPELPHLPSYAVENYEAVQRYVIELWIEKNTVSPYVRPLAERYKLVMQTCRGRSSEAMAREFVKRIERYKRPVIVLYISDLDPVGQNIPIAMARHVEYYLWKHGSSANVRIIPIVLTLEQVHQQQLPVSEFAENTTEEQRRKFTEQYGINGVVELDTLTGKRHPGVLRTIIETAILQFYDVGLESKVREARRKLEKHLDAGSTWITDQYADEISKLQAVVDAIVEAVGEDRAYTFAQDVEQLWGRMRQDLERKKPSLDDFPVPEGKEVAASGEELFDSTRNEREQLATYKRFQGQEAVKKLKRQGAGSTQISAENARKHTDERMKLSQAQEEEVRTLYRTGEYTQKQLADMFEVSQATVHRILLGKKQIDTTRKVKQ